MLSWSDSDKGEGEVGEGELGEVGEREYVYVCFYVSSYKGTNLM